jgi:predicted nucleic acid-binding protein
MRSTLKQLLSSFVEQGLEASDLQAAGRPRRAADLPRIDADLPLTPAQLSNAGLFVLLLQPGVRLVDEAAASWPVFRQLLSSDFWPARLCTDVHLAAIAITAGWRLVSFDRDFGRFSGLSWLPLAGE